MPEKVYIRIYSATENPEKLYEIAEEVFQGIASGRNAPQGLIELQDDSFIGLSLFQESDNSEEFEDQIRGMTNYFYAVDAQNEHIKQNTINQILLCNNIFSIDFTPDEIDERTDGILDHIFIIAEQVNGIVLLPDMSLYVSSGELLLNLAGESDLADFSPKTDNIEEKVYGKRIVSEADKARVKNCNEKILAQGLPKIPSHIPCELTEAQVKLAKVRIIAQRIFALQSVVLYSEAMLQNQMTPEEAYEFISDFVEQHHIENFWSLEERDYLLNQPFDETTAVQFGWRFEALNALMWTLGHTPALHPEKICGPAEIRQMNKKLLAIENINDFIKQSTLRPSEEILAQFEYFHRLHWLQMQQEVAKKAPLSAVDYGVIMEVHYALRWLLDQERSADWDTVKPIA